QVYDWFFQKRVFDFSQMSNLPDGFRQTLIDTFTFPKWEVADQVSVDGTVKYHFTLEDGKSIESVWIPEEDRATLCVSSQVGCALKCQFCVTGLQGFLRNLTQSEILEQIRYIQCEQGKKISNLVFMGMGEPLLNYENLCQAIDLLKHPKAFNFGHRKISVSTAGTVPKILPFIDRTNVSLAVSLTGSNNESRNRWMPINQKYNLEVLKETLLQVPQNKWKKIMFEVVMIAGETDTPAQAKNLVKFLQGMKAKVNLIPYNENSHFPHLKAPKKEDLFKYRDILMKAGYYVSIRRNRGEDIMGACGQLSSHLNQAKL
ncbi:MAG: 23S rRNA (adenine(2503)-C(2))-methyltransferase RlmN, partial [Deltaproteobacteria bacterium]|nr:23S rRNA (adenine(2503)-C(2))-methyltransferase RlmN [Deltaproteobacteria bacterium]